VVAELRLHVVRRRDAWVFPSSDDPSKPAPVDRYRRRVNEIARRVGIGRFNLKLLRHTYASHLLVYENAPPHYVQAQLGHHSPDFTQRVYGHLLARDRGRYADRLDDGAEKRNDARDVTG
jgi:integrase